MNRLISAAAPLFAAAALLSSLPASANIERPLDPVYLPGSQYTATLQPSTQLWRLAPLDGTDVEIRASALCPHTAVPGRGLWLLGRDADGRAELVAPSATLLPPGHSGRIALRACDDPQLADASQPAFGVPAQVLDLLLAETGAVLVDE